MTRRFHAATFIVSRTSLFPNLLQDKSVRPWFTKAVQARHTVMSKTVEEARKLQFGEKVVPESEFFIQGLGPLFQHPPRSPLIKGIYPNSGLIIEPFCIPANWRITTANTLENISFTVRLRIHLYQHGVCTPALYCQITHVERGWTGEEFVDLLRGFVDANHREATVFNVTTNWDNFKGTANDILNRAIHSIAKGVFQAEHRDDALMRCRRLEPDHLLLDVGKTSPQLSLPEDDEEIARLLALTANPDRQVTHDRQEKLGLLKKDWIGANTKHFLFCDTMHPWPTRNPAKGRKRFRGARRSLRKQGPIVWRMFKAVELVRSHRLLAQVLTEMFQKSNLAMTRARNLSKDFLKNMIKTTFYDDRLFTLALDIPSVQTSIYGRDKAILNYLANIMSLKESEVAMEAEAAKFEGKVKDWKPTILCLTDLLKLLK
ncbi:hypothetical protein [Geobacter grbiciae]|uniref:hypothetical protein n=1 Tax=Geobacter grbiciae TaxID=155042 RepID=UPI001C00BEDB|nr:hypothetical protein [Geobacter grbiciae]MBT1077065.1 hypothetical protein [Geobacter grbiciae]